MKKSVAFAALNLVVIATASAWTPSASPITAQTIGNFVGSHFSPGLCPVTAVQTSDHSISFCASGDQSVSLPTDLTNHSSGDFSSCLVDLQNFLTSLDLDSTSSQDLQNLISHLPFDARVVSALEMFVQNHDCNSGGDNIEPGQPESDEQGDDMENNDSDHDVSSNDQGNDNDQGENEQGNDFDDDDLPTAVPEPGTIGMFVTGFALLAGAMLRRRSV